MSGNPPDLSGLPPGLPLPEDDGAADHLPGLRLPSVTLPASSGRPSVSLSGGSGVGGVDLSALAGRTVLYCYPMTGRPDRELPEGWDTIPGARGCTPQACSFRDHHDELRELRVRVFGLSTQTPEYQREAAERLHLPFELLSDSELCLTRSLRLPTFEVDGMTLVKRLTLVLREHRIERVFYPVFPPDASAGTTLEWLRRNSKDGG